MPVYSLQNFLKVLLTLFSWEEDRQTRQRHTAPKIMGTLITYSELEQWLIQGKNLYWCTLNNSWRITFYIWIRESVTSWTVCGAMLWCWMHQHIMTDRCSISFRSAEETGQSMTSMPPSSRNCLHTLATQGPTSRGNQDLLHEWCKLQIKADMTLFCQHVWNLRVQLAGGGLPSSANRTTPLGCLTFDFLHVVTAPKWVKLICLLFQWISGWTWPEKFNTGL